MHCSLSRIYPLYNMRHTHTHSSPKARLPPVTLSSFHTALTLKHKCRIHCLAPQLSETILNLPLCSSWPLKRWWALPNHLCFCTTSAWAQCSGPCYSWYECNCRKGHISLGLVHLPKPYMSWDPLTSQCSHPLKENQIGHEMQWALLTIMRRATIIANTYWGFAMS